MQFKLEATPKCGCPADSPRKSAGKRTGHQTKIWKIPNHNRDLAKRWCIPQMPSCNFPSGQLWLPFWDHCCMLWQDVPDWPMPVNFPSFNWKSHSEETVCVIARAAKSMDEKIKSSQGSGSLVQSWSGQPGQWFQFGIRKVSPFSNSSHNEHGTWFCHILLEQASLVVVGFEAMRKNACVEL